MIKSEHESILSLGLAMQTNKLLLLLLYYAVTSQKEMVIIYDKADQKHAVCTLFHSARRALSKLVIFKL